MNHDAPLRFFLNIKKQIKRHTILNIFGPDILPGRGELILIPKDWIGFGAERAVDPGWQANHEGLHTAGGSTTHLQGLEGSPKGPDQRCVSMVSSHDLHKGRRPS